jgi:TolB-like protein
LCDGISGEILDTLAQVNGLRVAGRTSSFSLKGKNTKEVGEKLNVGNVLEGSLQRQGNRVRVTAELTDARNGFRVWTETYDREVDGAFALQDEIARSIVDALKIKFGVRVSAHEQPGSGVNDRYLQGFFTDVTHPTGLSGVDISVPVQNPSDPFTVPDYGSAGDFDPRRPDTRVTAPPPETGLNTSVRDRALEAGLRTNKITADMIAAPPETAFNTSARHRALEASLRTNKMDTRVTAPPPETGLNTSVRDRALEPGLRTNKITADVTPAPPETGLNTSVRDRALEPGLRTNKITADATPAPPGTGVATSERYHASEAAPRTNKITADGSASILGFVKDAKGEPIKGADVRIESRNGKQVFSSVKTDPKGRYVSQRLEAGVYRVTLLVNGAVKASIMNTQTKANQPTQLNFDFKPTSQASNIAKGRKHMVWVPNRTGSHLGGAWVEVDDKGNEQAESNLETYTVRR